MKMIGGGVKIMATSIDNVLDGKKATFIKMDIEGSELMALRGAKNTITKWLPKLAISVYHKNEDMLEIPQYINDIALNKYDFYLRHHHSLCQNETVLYCIPRTY